MLNHYQVILFDLDGTLTDPKAGITRCVQYALENMGIIEPDLDQLEGFIGPPLQESFSTMYAFDAEQTSQAVAYYRERFQATGMYENELYPLIPELLAELKERGKVLAVATSKPTVFSEKILQHFHLDAYFDVVVGSNLDGTRSAKAEIIQTILDQYPEYDNQHFVMIGDRKHDLIGANRTGIDAIGVTYGYGSIEELRSENPAHIVHSVEQLMHLLAEAAPKGLETQRGQ